MGEFLGVSDTDGVWVQHEDELPLPLHRPSPLPEGWMHTGFGWDIILGGIMIEAWHLRRII